MPRTWTGWRGPCATGVTRSTSSTAPMPSTRCEAGTRSAPTRRPPGFTSTGWRAASASLSPLATQVTGRPYFKAEALRAALDAVDTDVVHFHNISLIGGPGVLHMGRHAVRIMTAHEHWLICPMHLLWKFGRRACDSDACLRCVLAGRRPPQAWRYTGAIDRGLRQLDALVFPSRHALEEHRRRGIGAPMVHLPYFLPDDWSGGIEDEEPEPTERPYLAAAGRLVRMKGFQRLIPLMRYLPEVDLRIAGTGPYETHAPRPGRGAAQRPLRGPARRPRARPAVPRGARRRRAVAVPRDVRLRRPRGLRRADPGGRPRRGRRAGRDGRPERRRPGLSDRCRAAPGAPADRPRRRPPRTTGPWWLASCGPASGPRRRISTAISG